MIDLNKIKSQKTTKELLQFGIINIDKSAGPTSFQVSQYVKYALKLNKTSHLGTLDPMVTGVLPVGLGRACRLNEYLMHRDKTYIGVMRVHVDITEKELQKIMDDFSGKIMQLPPVRSRVKRAIRERDVKEFRILEKVGKDVLFVSAVEAGTYIRKLCSDVGEKIGGAHMSELRRTNAGIFDENSAKTLYEFDTAVESYNKGDDKLIREMITPGEIVGLLLPIIRVKQECVKKLLTGSPVFISFLEKELPANLVTEDKVAVFCEDKLIGCYKYNPSQDFIAKPEFVCN